MLGIAFAVGVGGVCGRLVWVALRKVGLGVGEEGVTRRGGEAGDELYNGIGGREVDPVFEPPLVDRDNVAVTVGFARFGNLGYWGDEPPLELPLESPFDSEGDIARFGEVVRAAA